MTARQRFLTQSYDWSAWMHQSQSSLSWRNSGASLAASLLCSGILTPFRNVIITSGTMSPLDLYPKLLNFTPKVSESFPMSLYSARATVCPLIVTKGNDQTELTSKFESRRDPSIVANFGKLLLELAQTVPDGMVCFFTR